MFQFADLSVQPNQVQYDTDKDDHQYGHYHIYFSIAAQHLVNGTGLSILLLRLCQQGSAQ
jgi:hypothetical protein